jgi:DNA-binding winged helix-turn-helix (wHTH) protein
MSPELKDVFEFGPYRIDLEQRLLKRGDQVIPLAPKVLETLLVLVENHGRVLEKAYLLKKVWPDTFVEEGSLTRNISTLRKALGHGPDDENYIATVPKRGYRFGAAITKVTSNDTGHGETNQSGANIPTAPVPNSSPPPRRLAPWLIAAFTTLLAIVFAALYFQEVQPAASSERSARFLVSLPENVGPGRASPAISPDGEKLVFGGVDPDGKTRLWFRPLASLTAEPIPGSDGAVSAFWSPDSRSVGFFAGGKLKRSDLGGGPPQILCDASDSLRPVGTWNRDGVILFNSEDRHGLHRVPATGGEATPVTAFNASRQENLHAWPQFLPDGRHFIYLIQSDQPQNTGIYAGSLDSNVSKQLINTSTNPAYAGLPSGTGYLLYMHAATLMAQRFDTNKLELQGEAFPVADQVLLPPAPARGFAAFSASGNGVLAYRTLAQATTEIVWFDRQGLETTPFPLSRQMRRPSLSPERTPRLEPVTYGFSIWCVGRSPGLRSILPKRPIPLGRRTAPESPSALHKRAMQISTKKQRRVPVTPYR